MILSGQKNNEVFRDLLFLVPAAAFFLLFSLGTGSLASWDEATYAAIARAIVRSGDWLVLRYEGEVWFEKPPLTFWLMALSFKIFGVSESAARLYPAVCGAGIVITTYLLGLKLLDRRTAFAGAFILLSAAHFLRIARFAVTDAPLVLFLTLAFYLFFLGRTRPRCLWLAGVPFGLALMTKGFIALVYLPITFGFCLLSKESKILRSVHYWGGVLLGAVMIMPWFIYQYSLFGDKFTDSILGLHVIDRAFTAIEGHEGNYYFYIRTFINKFRPWFFIGLFSFPLFLYKALRERKPEIIFLMSWIVFFFALITFARTKLHWYILPLYPPLSLTMGYVFSRLLRVNRGILVILFLAVLVSHIPLSRIFSPEYPRDIEGIAPQVKAQVESGYIFLYDYHQAPAAAFYLEKKGKHVDDPESFLKALREHPDFYCLIHRENFKELAGELGEARVRIAGEYGDFLLVTKK